MRGVFLTLSALAVFSSKALAGDTILSREFPSCGYVGEQIYCWGGNTHADFDGQDIDTNLYSLNISQFSGKPTDSMSGQWNQIKPAVPFATEKRRTPAASVPAGGNKFMLQGGFNTFSGKLVNQTIVYDVPSNTWQTALPYKEADRGARQIFFAGAVNLPNNLVGYYGGIEQNADASIPQISASGVAMNYTAQNMSYVGFSSLQMYSPNAQSWTAFTPQLNIPVNYYPNSQSATLDPSTGKIYYFGGSYNTPTSNPYSIRSPFNWGYTFNTKTGEWLNETYTGTVPSNRIYHTAEMLPNSRDIIIYGGRDASNTAVTDFCYTLNLATNTWTKQNLNVPSYLSGPRFTHASVLVNTTMFILFGRALDGSFSPSLLTIDVSNVSSIVYTATYNASANNTIPDPIPVPTQETGLSKGAIGGIAAGCIALVLAIIAIAVYCCVVCRKRQSKQDTMEQYPVDWDKIDNQYKEIPLATHPPHTKDSEIDSSQVHSYQSDDGDHTVFDSSHEGSNLFSNNRQLQNSIVKPSAIEEKKYDTVKPNAI